MGRPVNLWGDKCRQLWNTNGGPTLHSIRYRFEPNPQATKSGQRNASQTEPQILFNRGWNSTDRDTPDNDTLDGCSWTLTPGPIMSVLIRLLLLPFIPLTFDLIGDTKRFLRGLLCVSFKYVIH